MTQIPPHPPAPGSQPTGDEVPADGHSAGHPLRLVGLALVVALLGLMGGVSVLAIVAGIVIMIFLHELGHYLTARWSGMKVTEFFIGFGPRIWSFTRGETEYGLKVIPAGAYVRIIGMNNLDPVDPADESRTYRSKSYPRRLSVAVAGSAMHFVMAIVLSFVVFAGFGIVTEESEADWTVAELSSAADMAATYGPTVSDDLGAVLDDGRTPASDAGLEPGDRVVAADGEELADYVAFRDFVRAHPGDTVTLLVERGEETFTTQLTIGRADDPVTGEAVGVVGLGPDFPLDRLGPVDATRESVAAFGEITVASLEGIARFFTPSGLSNFVGVVLEGDEPADEPTGGSGPATAPTGDGGGSEDEGRILSIVGAARLGAEATDDRGPVALLQFLVLLNVFIGIFNLIPLLPLDGGHVAVATYERIREIGRRGRYHADVAKLLPLTYGVVVFLVTIGVMALYADLVNPVQLQ